MWSRVNSSEKTKRVTTRTASSSDDRDHLFKCRMVTVVLRKSRTLNGRRRIIGTSALSIARIMFPFRGAVIFPLQAQSVLPFCPSPDAKSPLHVYPSKGAAAEIRAVD